VTSAAFSKLARMAGSPFAWTAAKRKLLPSIRVVRHFDHGYAVTFHSAQGLTAERVLVNMDTDVHPDLMNNRFAYVSVSRASHDAQVFTNNATTLAESLSCDVSKASAIDFGKSHASVVTMKFEQPGTL
jgi:pterin-4a-carbinolamine dehydratase